MSNSGTADGEERNEPVAGAESTSHVDSSTTPADGIKPGAGSRYMPTYSLLFGGSAAMLAAALLGVGYFSQNGAVVLTGLAVFTLATVVLVIICGVIIFWIVRNYLPFPRSLFKWGRKVPPNVKQGVNQP